LKFRLNGLVELGLVTSKLGGAADKNCCSVFINQVKRPVINLDERGSFPASDFQIRDSVVEILNRRN
jgi:hypothetical protein